MKTQRKKFAHCADKEDFRPVLSCGIISSIAIHDSDLLYFDMVLHFLEAL